MTINEDIALANEAREEYDAFMNETCYGCGRTAKDICKEDFISAFDLYRHSIRPSSEIWFCFEECLEVNS